jgi:hypothetical protein
MRLPWSKDKEESDLPRDERGQEDDPGYEEAGDPGEVEETLDDVEPDLKARFDKHLAGQRDQWVAEQRAREERLREWGLDFTSDGSPAIRDQQKVAAWASHLAPRAEPAPRAVVNPEEPEEEINFFDMDAAKFNQLVEKRAGKLVDQKLSEFSQKTAWQEEQVRSMSAQDALRRAEGVVSRHSPHYAPILNHPDFEASFLDAMRTTSPEQLQDERSLAALIGGIGAFLDMTKLPTAKGRDREGRFASAQASRASLSQVGPSRDSSRAGVPQAPEEEAARRFLSDLTGREMTARDVEAAGCRSIDEWRKARASKK